MMGLKSYAVLLMVLAALVVIAFLLQKDAGGGGYVRSGSERVEARYMWVHDSLSGVVAALHDPAQGHSSVDQNLRIINAKLDWLGAKLDLILLRQLIQREEGSQ